MILGLLGWLAGCTFATPFRGPGYDSGRGITLPLTEQDTVVVGLTHATLGDDGAKNAAFTGNIRKIVATMDRHEGLIGYSVRRQLFGNEFWTMTVWKDEASLIAFIRGREHDQAVLEGSPALADNVFARVILPREAIPLSWDQAEALLAKYGTPYPRPVGQATDLTQTVR